MIIYLVSGLFHS